jgi:hypothetical protein
MTWLRPIAVFSLGLLTLQGAAAEDPKTEIPADVLTVLQKADRVELLTVNPVIPETKPKDKEMIREWIILAKPKAPLKEAKVEELVTGMKAAVLTKPEKRRCGFMPRYALRASHQGKAVEILIDWKCPQAYIYVGDRLVKVQFDEELAKKQVEIYEAAKPK